MNAIVVKKPVGGTEGDLDFITIIIVNWNGKKWLETCMSSLDSQDFKQFEVIVVDNASTDGSVDFLQANHPEVRVVKNDTNVGFALANNLGIREARGNYVLLLNNDTSFDSDFLTRLLGAFSRIPNLGAVQPRVVLMSDPEKLEACGYYWTSSSFLYPYGFRKQASLPLYDHPMPFFSLTGAALLIPRNVLDRVGVFDDDFFCYYEDTDLCNRIWLSGFECWYFPEAEIRHAVGGTSHVLDPGLVQFHYQKNRISSIIKNFEFRTLVFTLPVFFFLNALLGLLRLALGSPGDLRGLIKAMGYNSRNIRGIARKRKIVQAGREASDKVIFGRVRINPGFRFYFDRLMPYDD